MAIFGSSGPKKPINWAVTGGILFVLASLAIYVADNVFHVSFIKFSVFFLIAMVGVLLFIILRFSKSISAGTPMSFENWVMILIVLGLVVGLYWKFPQLMPNASDFSIALKSAFGGP